MLKKTPFYPLLLMLILAGMTACTLASVTATAITLAPSITPLSTHIPTLTKPPSNTLAPTQASSFADAWAYCAAVGSIDTPDSRYTGSKMPEALVQGLKKASGSAPDAPDEWFTSGSYWRCMGGEVYACTVGATPPGVPCSAKANTDKTPTQAEIDFCQANPDAVGIPAAVTGHDSLYAWRCQQNEPVIDQQVFHVDARGFIAEIWYVIPLGAGQ